MERGLVLRWSSTRVSDSSSTLAVVDNDSADSYTALVVRLLHHPLHVPSHNNT